MARFLVFVLFAFAFTNSNVVGFQTEPTPAQKPQEPSQEEKEKRRAKQRARWSFEADESLPNVLIIGDSISVGYTLEVRKQLAGKANVYRPMGNNGTPQNCQGTTLGVESIDNWLAGHQWDVIHFNWGLHDLKHVKEAGASRNSNDPNDPYQATVEQYSQNLTAIVEKLKATDAKLIFATTTPVVPESQGPLREADAPTRYNAAALEIMQTNEIEVNDLFAFCSDKLEEIQLPKNVHFKAAGSRLLGEQVAQAIETNLAADDEAASDGQ